MLAIFAFVAAQQVPDLLGAFLDSAAGSDEAWRPAPVAEMQIMGPAGPLAMGPMGPLGPMGPFGGLHGQVHIIEQRPKVHGMQIIQLGGGLKKGEDVPLDAILQAFGGFIDPLAVPVQPKRAGPRPGMRGAPLPRPANPDEAMFEDVLSLMGLQAHPSQRFKPKVPAACEQDFALHCAEQQGLHCLAQHGTDLTEQCHETLKRSLPVVCGEALQKCDQFTEGILTCLKRQHEAAALHGDCGETYSAAVQTMAKVQQAGPEGVKVVDLSSGLQRPLAGDDEGYLQEFTDFLSAVV